MGKRRKRQRKLKRNEQRRQRVALPADLFRNAFKSKQDRIFDDVTSIITSEQEKSNASSK